MGKYITGVADSKSGAGHQFDTPDAAASTYLLDAGAFLRSTNDDCIVLGGGGAWTVTINGQASSDATIAGSALVVNANSLSKVTVGEDGSLRTGGDAAGALFASSDLALVNKGLIRNDTGNGMWLDGNGANSISNSGAIIGPNLAVYVPDATSFAIDNSGQIFGGIGLNNGGTNKLVNTGQITTSTEYGVTSSNIVFGSGADSVDNKGLISGSIDLGNGLNKATNAGLITGTNFFGYAIAGGGDGDVITNAKGGVIQYGVSLGNGANSFTNAGFVGNNGIDDSLTGGNQIDTVKNSGVLNGGIHLFDGNDVFTNTGQVSGFIDLGDGDDTFKGGNFAEMVSDSFGSDKITLGGGNDTFIAFGGDGDGKDGLMGNPVADSVDGGTGVDTYDGSQVVEASGTGIRVNLDGADHEGILKGTARDGSGVYIDTLKGFENVTGSSFEDVVYGSSAANVISGGAGNDYLYGLAGNDVIDGGNDNDRVAGGLGADILRGGSGEDSFYYMDIKDSGLTKATRDVIEDYVENSDNLDLSLLDADTRTGGVNDAFGMILTTSNFVVGVAQTLRIYQTAIGWMIDGEVTGDGKADFSIAVNDLDHSINWGFNTEIIA